MFTDQFFNYKFFFLVKTLIINGID